MNTSYRSIFNETLGAWVAVSETTRARGKRAGACVSLAAALALGALPAGAQSVLYWDSNGATAGAGGTPGGTWSLGGGGWSTAEAGDVATGLWADGNFAVFAAGADASASYVVNLGSNVTATGL